MKNRFSLHISLFFEKFIQKLNQRVENSGAQYIAFGIFGLINYPLSYFMWQGVIPQNYNPFSLRLVAGILCIPLILKNYWPRNLTKLLPTYWYLTLLYCLPFFGTYMLLQNHASYAWLMNVVLGLLLFMLLVDWLSFITLLGLGIIIGIFCYWVTTNHLNVPISKDSINLALYLYFFVIVIGAVFSRNKEKVAAEKLRSTQIFASSIAHELRTPLRTINSGVNGIKRYLPDLITGYRAAQTEKLEVPYIIPSHYETLITACDDIAAEANAAFTVVDMLLVKAQHLGEITTTFEPCVIGTCIEDAIERYPYDTKERKLVHWENKNNFTFNGNKLLMTHIVFNLLKNALYHIKAAGKGEIFLWTETTEGAHKLYFKDTGTGIPRKILSRIFDRFYSNTPHGAGIGLAFCQIVIEAMGGRISCRSKEGEYTEFTLTFPPLPLLRDSNSLETR